MRKLLLCSLFLTTQFLFAQDLSDYLKVYYPMNGSTLDYSGNAYHGTPYGVTFVEDRFGNPEGACHFDGIDNYVEFPNVEDMKTPLPVAFSYWVKYDSTDYQKQVILNTSFENNRCSGVWINSEAGTGRMAVNFGNGAGYYSPNTRQTYISNTVIDTEQWHHVAIVVVAADLMLIFVDGVEAGGTYDGFGETLAYSLTPGVLGRHDRNLDLPADYFQGSIDDFAYWGNRILNQDEVIALREGTAVLSVPQHPSQERFTVYPVPVKDVLNVSKGDFKMTMLYNSLGQKVYEGQWQPQISVGHLAPGVYYLTTDNPAISRRIVKE